MGSLTCTKVGGAAVDVAVLLVLHEGMTRLLLDGVLNGLDPLGQPLENLFHVPALLHGDDPQLVLLVDPGQEGFLLVVEDPSSFRPVALHAGNLEVGVSRHEEEVVIHQLLAYFLSHPCEREVGSGQVTAQVSKGLLHKVLHPKPLLLGDPGRKPKPINAAPYPDPGGVDRSSGVDGSLDLGGIHIAGVLAVGRDTVVLLDQRVKHVSEHLSG